MESSKPSANKQVDSKDLIIVANNLSKRFGGVCNINNIEQCDHKYFIDLYENMLGEKLPGLVGNVTTIEDEIHNVQVVIDSLATDILGLDLLHIDAQGVALRNEIHLQNLLEIFDGLLEIVLEELESDNDDVMIEQHKRTQADGKENYLQNNQEEGHDTNDVFVEEFDEDNIVKTPLVNHAVNKAYHKEKFSSKHEAEGRDKKQTAGDKIKPSFNHVTSLSWVSHGKDSTEELIREADLIEQNEKRLRSEKTVDRSTNQTNSPLKPSEKSHTPSDPWSSLLTHSSSVVDKLSELNEVGKRPRRPLGKEKAKKEQRVGENVQMHRHTHHHYYVNKDSPANSLTESSSTLSLTKQRSLEQLEKSIPTNSLASESKSSMRSPNSKSVKLQTFSPELVETGVQTVKSRRLLQDKSIMINSWRNESKLTSDPSNDTRRLSPSSYLNCGKRLRRSRPVSRSMQLLNINERLKLLRNVETSSTQVPSTGIRSTEPPSTSTSNIADCDNRSRSRVSFAIDSNDRHVSFSDTEIDYLSPLRHQSSTTNGRARKGILRKSVYSSTTCSDDDSMHDDSTSFALSSHVLPSYSSRYEIPLLRRDEGLYDIRKAIKSEKRKRDNDIARLRTGYSKQKSAYKKLKNVATRKQSNIIANNARDDVAKKPRRRGKTFNRTESLSPQNTYAKNLANIYGQRGRLDKTTSNRRRSASSSPVPRRRRKKTLVMRDEDILPTMEEEFPFIYLSPHTAKLMWQKQMREADRLRNANMAFQKPHSKTSMRMNDARKRQELLTNIMKKELEHNKRLREYKERKYNDTLLKRKLKERRQNAARARRYYDEYHKLNKARMTKKRTKEEKLFKQLFEDALEIQKQRLREMRDYARQKNEKNARQQENEIESMENYYRDQFAMLAQNVAEERHELEVRQTAQKKALGKMRTEIRRKMENDIKAIQDQLANDDDPLSFRQIDADNLRREFQIATYRSSRMNNAP